MTTTDDTTKRAAIYMLRHGLATYIEVANLSGRSRQIVRHWALEHDCPDSRADRLARTWEAAIRREAGARSDALRKALAAAGRRP
jgi:hypothetical protein